VSPLDQLRFSLREVHPEALVFVSGTDWGYDLRGVRIDREHVVYAGRPGAGATSRI
jgi:hypothetical protein